MTNQIVVFLVISRSTWHTMTRPLRRTLHCCQFFPNEMDFCTCVLTSHVLGTCVHLSVHVRLRLGRQGGRSTNQFNFLCTFRMRRDRVPALPFLRRPRHRSLASRDMATLKCHACMGEKFLDRVIPTGFELASNGDKVWGIPAGPPSRPANCVRAATPDICRWNSGNVEGGV